MNEEKEKVFNFLDNRLGHASGSSFEDYEDKKSILKYAINDVGESEDLTCGCGVGPLIDYIEEWVDQFEQESITQETCKYEEKLIQEIKKNGLFNESKADDIQIVANYLYSKEGQTEMLDQSLKQIKSNKSNKNLTIKNINFEIKKENEIGTKIACHINALTPETLLLINEFINKDFKIILRENIEQLIHAFGNINELKDLKKKNKM